jgi:hypothetical protein
LRSPDNEPGLIKEPTVELSLPLEAAETLHAALEDMLESGTREEDALPLERAYRVLAWRILAVKDGSGLTATISEIARRSRTVEEYEAARDETLGPIIGGLENPENRDP